MCGMGVWDIVVSALTLMVEWQEGRPACKILVPFASKSSVPEQVLLLFWHAPVGVHSAVCRHQPPQRMVLASFSVSLPPLRSRWMVFSHVI